MGSRLPILIFLYKTHYAKKSKVVRLRTRTHSKESVYLKKDGSTIERLDCFSNNLSKERYGTKSYKIL